MRRMGKWALVIALAMLTAIGVAAAASEAPEVELTGEIEVELTGEINEIYQFVTEDGEVYEIGINDVGNELVDSHINDKVRLRGTVGMAEDGARVITVTSFEVISE